MNRLILFFINIILSNQNIDQKELDTIIKHLNLMENNFVSNFDVKIEGYKDDENLHLTLIQ